MAKLSSMAAIENTPKALHLAGILRESLHLPSKNQNLMISITLLALIPFSLLALSHNLISGPFLIELEDHEFNGENLDPRFKNDIEILMGLELVFFSAFCILSLFTMATTIYASASTYTGNHMNVKDLISRIAATWKRPVITCMYISLIAISYVVLVVAMFGAFSLVFYGGVLIAWISMVGFLAVMLYLYLAAVWLLGLVISIVEDDCYGMKAIERAVVLIKGRRIQGFALMLLLILMSAPITLLFSINTVEDELGTASRVMIGTVETVLVCLVKLFTYVVFTVFYYQCKRRHGEKEEMEEEARYRLVSTNFRVDDSLP